jgi:hypothetical protein
VGGGNDTIHFNQLLQETKVRLVCVEVVDGLHHQQCLSHSIIFLDGRAGEVDADASMVTLTLLHWGAPCHCCLSPFALLHMVGTMQAAKVVLPHFFTEG